MAAGFKTATVNASDVPSTQTNFPVYVDLSRLGITTLAEAQSVRVYADSDKTTEWAREIVSATEMHVKVPSLTSTTAIYVDWDGIRADYAVTDTYGRNSVWTGYAAVLHGGALIDSTGNTTVTQSGSVSYTAGKLGTSFSLPGTGANYPIIVHNAVMNFTTNMYFSAWMQNLAASSRRSHFSKGSWTVSTGYWLHSAVDSKSLQISTPGSSYAGFQIQDADGYDSNEMHHFVYRKTSGSGMSYHVNGIKENTVNNANSNRNMTTNTLNVLIGRRTDEADAWHGPMGEVRFSATPYSDDWITTEYNNQSDEAGFWGTWTDVGGGNTAANSGWFNFL